MERPCAHWHDGRTGVRIFAAWWAWKRLRTSDPSAIALTPA
jgi:hypothetical protein